MQKIIEIINELNKTTSSNRKKEILKENKNNEEFKKILYWTYNPFIKFFVSSKNLIKNKDLNNVFEIYNVSLDELLTKMSNREITGHEAIKKCLCFLNNKSKEYKELFYKIIDKNLKCRIDSKLINKVIPGFIPEFSVALAISLEKYNKFQISEKYYVSRKMDGLRCVSIIDEDGNVDLYSRTGQKFNTMDVLKKEIEKLNLKNIVLDGECCLVDEKGKEDFSGMMRVWNRKNYIIKNPKYLIFDYLSLDDFNNKKSKEIFSERIEKLNKIDLKSNNLKVIKQIFLKDEKHLYVLKEQARKRKWEGLILRKDTIYKGKRSNDILKHKLFKDGEFKVLDIKTGNIRHIVSGKDTEEKMVSDLIINYNGEEVKVGSGLSMEQRVDWFFHPEKIINKIITVKYFEVTDNIKGTSSLRFPTLKAVHGEKRTV